MHRASPAQSCSAVLSVSVSAQKVDVSQLVANVLDNTDTLSRPISPFIVRLLPVQLRVQPPVLEGVLTAIRVLLLPKLGPAAPPCRYGVQFRRAGGRGEKETGESKEDRRGEKDRWVAALAALVAPQHTVDIGDPEVRPESVRRALLARDPGTAWDMHD